MSKESEARLGRNKDPTQNHHACTKQSLTDVALMKKQVCPEDGQDGTQCEERRHIPNQAKRNGSEPKEWGDACNEHSEQEGARMGTQSFPCVLIGYWLFAISGSQCSWCEQQDHE